MTVIELPVLRTTDVIAVTIERAELAGSFIWVVTARESADAQPRRRWYPDPAPALAYAGEQADLHGLPLIDLRDPDGEL